MSLWRQAATLLASSGASTCISVAELSLNGSRLNDFKPQSDFSIPISWVDGEVFIPCHFVLLLLSTRNWPKGRKLDFLPTESVYLTLIEGNEWEVEVLPDFAQNIYLFWQPQSQNTREKCWIRITYANGRILIGVFVREHPLSKTLFQVGQLTPKTTFFPNFLDRKVLPAHAKSRMTFY